MRFDRKYMHKVFYLPIVSIIIPLKTYRRQINIKDTLTVFPLGPLLHFILKTYYYIKRNGQKLPVSISVTPVIMDGKIMAC